jgi:AcrR family transcriptional regulator
MVVDDVARLAGASKRTVYRHYPTKVDLAVAGIRRLPSILEWGEGHGDVKERLARATATAFEREPLFAAVMATSLVHRDSVPQLLATLRADVSARRLQAARQQARSVLRSLRKASGPSSSG